MHADIVILGAGIVGSSVAWHLAQRGLRDILLLDRAPRLGEGSTGKATGGFRAQFANETEIRLSLLSRGKLERFREQTGAESGYAPHGYLFLASAEAELETLRQAQRLQHACGLTEAVMVSAVEARRLNPAIESRSVIGGAFCPTDGFIQPMSMLRGYAAAAQRLGARYELGVEWNAFRTEGDRVVAAVTSHGEIEARIFINALGAWSGFPVRPVRRNVAATVATNVLPESMPMTVWSGDWYHLRVRDGRVLLLWTDDPPVGDHEWLETVLRFTRERVPILDGIEIAEMWSGFYEMSPDEHALLGRDPSYENLYLATGSSGHGVMHAPALGQLLAEMLVDGRTSIDVTPLDPARFKR